VQGLAREVCYNFPVLNNKCTEI